MNQPAYCILRAEKLTSLGSIAGSAKHTFREILTPNADPDRTHLNWTGGAKSSAEVRAAIKARLPVARRKDAVLCIEYLITASPEWCKATPWKTQRKYFNDAIAWLRARHGAANVVCLNLQLDETSPHLVAYVVPLTVDGRLSAKDFLGGRKVLSDMQTQFADQVGKPVGLQRGIQGSKAKHTTSRQYAAALQKNPTLAAPATPAPTIADRITGRAKKMEDDHAAQQAKHAALLEQTRNVALVGQHARIRQAAALEELRHREERREDEAARLRDENRLLQRELQAQRTHFQRQVEELKAALAKAVNQVKELLEQVGILAHQLTRADAERKRVSAIAPHFGAIALDETRDESSMHPSTNRV
jgi:hypothetical protein